MKGYTTTEWQKGEASLKEASRAVSKIIETALRNNTGALIGRQGSIELEAVLSHVLARAPLTDTRKTLLENNAGIYPATDTVTMEAWRVEYLDSIQNADALVVGWFAQLADLEENLLKALNFSGVPIPLRTLEPYYLSEPWTKYLGGQRLTVVSSFAETMKQQLPKLSEIWNGKNPLSRAASIEFVRSYYSPMCAEGKCEWPEQVHNSIDAIDYLENQVIQRR